MFKKGHTSFWKGKKLSLEHRKNLSNSHKGYRIPNEQKKKISESVKNNLPSTSFKKGNIPYNKNEKRPDMIGNQFAKRKHSLKERIDKSKRSFGANNINWKGGKCIEKQMLRNRIEGKIWRESVYKRDNFICKKCLLRGGKLNPHHIYNFADNPQLRFEINNGITLCENCHNKFHSRYGKNHTNFNQLKEFLDTSEVDDIVVSDGSFYYNTTHTSIESGDV